MTSPKPDLIQHGRRRLTFALPLLAYGLVVPSVHATADVYQASQIMMGTRVDLTLQDNDRAALTAAAEMAFAEMARLADMMTRYSATSALSAINLMAGLKPVSVPPELLHVLSMACQVAQASGGAFDATVGSLRDWDFSPEHPSIPSPQQIKAQLRLVDQKAGLVLNEHAGTAYLTQRGMQLDLGGIAKLPILQAGLRQLQSRGVTNAMINGGGDVLVMGQLNGHPWRVGLRDPRQPSKLLGVVALSQGFVAASGDYERFFMYQGQRFHHILNPKTGYPTHGPHGVTLISEQLELINGVGAALMVAGVEAGRTRISSTPGLDALIVDADSDLWLSSGMAQRLKHG